MWTCRRPRSQRLSNIVENPSASREPHAPARNVFLFALASGELLKKFAEAHRLFYDREEGDRGTIRQLGLRDSDTFMDDDISDTIAAWAEYISARERSSKYNKTY